MSFQCGLKIIITVEVPQNVKLTCTKSQIEGSLVRICREYGLQPGRLKGKVEHLVFIKSNFAGLRQSWEPYLKLEVLCSAFMYSRHSMEIQNMSGFGIKDCLTEASFFGSVFGQKNKDREFYTFNNKYVRNFLCRSIKWGRVNALIGYFESNQSDELLNTIKIHMKKNK